MSVHSLLSFFFFFFNVIVDVQANLRVLRLIPQGVEVYSRILIIMVMRELELMTIEEQIQDLTTKLLLGLDYSFV